MGRATVTRKISMVILLLLMAALPALADKVLATGTTRGKFLRIDQGDYTHFVMRDSKGQEQDFFIIKGDGTVDKFVATPAKYKGKAVQVRWQRVMSNIPEAGGEIEIRQVTSVKLL